MAFDQNTCVPNESRRINVTVDDPRIVPIAVATATTAAGRPVETGDSPDSVPVYYPASGIPDAGFSDFGYGNDVPAARYPPCGRGAIPAGHTSLNPALGLRYSSNLLAGVTGTAFDQMGGTGSDAATKFCAGPNLGTRVGGGRVDQVIGVNVGSTGVSSNSAPTLSVCGPERVFGDFGSETGVRLDAFTRTSRIGADCTSENGGVASVTSRKVKFLCSFGGKILPRPSDGMLRYVGGNTRIISVRREIAFNELVQKMVEIYGQPVVIKFQLPEEDLDALVSVSCPDDLDNMMEEYEKLVQRSSDVSGSGSAKLRIFLFSTSELDPSSLLQYRDLHDSGQRYMEAVNGIMDGIGCGIMRKESIASAASTQNSDMSGNNDVADSSVLGQADFTRSPSTSSSVMGQAELNMPPSTGNITSVSRESSSLFFVDQNSSANSDSSTFSNFGIPMIHPSIPQFQTTSGEVESEKPVPLSRPQAVPYSVPPPLMGFPSSQLMGTTGSIYASQQHSDGASSNNLHHYISPVHMTGPAAAQAGMRQAFIQPSQHAQFEPDGSSLARRIAFLPVDSSNDTYHHRVVVPPTTSGGECMWHPNCPPGKVVLSEGSMPNSQLDKLQKSDCYMCQMSLPHVHSDTLIQDQREGRTASRASMNPAAIYHSLPVDENLISQLTSKTVVSEGSGEGIRCSVAVGSVPHPCPDNGFPQHIMNKPMTMNIETCPVGIASVQGREQQSQGIPSDYSKLLDARMDTLQISGSEMLPTNGERNPLLIDNHRIAESLKLSKHQPQHNTRPEILLNPAEVAYLNYFRAGESNNNSQPSEIGIPRSNSQSKMGIQMDSQCLCNGNPLLSSEIFSSSAAWVDDNSLLQRMHAPPDGQVVPTDGNRQLFVPEMSRTEDLYSSNSLFSDQDPFKMHIDAHFPPPIPIKIVLRKDTGGTRDPLVDKNLSAKAGQMGSDLVNHLSSEQVQTSREERIGRDLQDVAEGVVASVLQSATSSELGFAVSEANKGASETMPEGEVRKVDEDTQSEAHSEDIEPDLSETVDLGFPASDGLGRLQIISNSDLEELRELGSGTYGTVYHGKWRGTDVAIKRINDRCFTGKPSEQEQMRSDFWNEAIKLADLHHPNVVAFYGVVVDGPGGSVATVTEYMVNGSLRNALQKSERNLDKKKRLIIAMDVAFGMEYLHGKNIVHFDLKSDNLLVNLRDPHRPICKVGDLGLSKVKCQTLISGGVRGTLPWMAPELLNGSSSLVSEKVDVFSFGIVLWELITGEEPYADLHYGAIIGGILSNTLRPAVPETCYHDWRSLMERCWSSEPSERPSFTDIANELRSMSVKILQKPQNQQ